MQIGDLTFATYSCNSLITNLLAAGDPLVEVQREAEHGLEFAREGPVRSRHRRHRRAARADPDAPRLDADIRLVSTMSGLMSSGSSAVCRVTRMLALAGCWYWIRKLQARFFAGDYVVGRRGVSGRATLAVDVASLL